MAGPPQRRAARVLLLDEADRVLLIRFEVQRSDGPFTFWATPGGGVEAGESDQEAAERELGEELGLRLELQGPVHVATARFEHEGALIVNTDVFYLARCAASAPQLAGATDEERMVLRQLRWWPAAELDAATEPVFPRDLVAVLRKVAKRLAEPGRA